MNVWLPLLTGLIGALIGSAGSVITIYLQMRSQRKREILKIASEVALEEYKSKLKIVEASGQDAIIWPICTYVHYHTKIIEAIFDGKLDEKKYRAIFEENQRIGKVCEKLNEEADREEKDEHVEQRTP